MTDELNECSRYSLEVGDALAVLAAAARAVRAAVDAEELRRLVNLIDLGALNAVLDSNLPIPSPEDIHGAWSVIRGEDAVCPSLLPEATRWQLPLPPAVIVQLAHDAMPGDVDLHSTAAANARWWTAYDQQNGAWEQMAQCGRPTASGRPCMARELRIPHPDGLHRYRKNIGCWQHVSVRDARAVLAQFTDAARRRCPTCGVAPMQECLPDWNGDAGEPTRMPIDSVPSVSITFRDRETRTSHRCHESRFPEPGA